MRLSFRIVDPSHLNAFPLLARIAGKNGLREFEYGMHHRVNSIGYVLALFQGEPIGYTQYSIRQEAEIPTLKTYETYVVRAWRQMGIAKAISGHLLRYASTRGYSVVDRSDPSNEMYRVNVQVERLARKGKKIWGRFIPPHHIGPSRDYWKVPADQLLYLRPRKKRRRS